MPPAAVPPLPSALPAGTYAKAVSGVGQRAAASATGSWAWVPHESRQSPWRHAPAVAGVLFAHVVALWGLLQVDAVRQALQENLPMMVELLPAPPPPQLPAPPPPPPPRRVITPPKPAPIIAAAPAPVPQPAAFEAPPPAEPPPVETVVADAAPAPPAPPAPPAEPKTVLATAVSYLQPPAPVYPAFSKRSGETGRVLVRVLLDTGGLPRQWQLQQSSGFARLDQSALTAMRAARFQPYTENGLAMAVWVLVPIVFELER